MGLGRGGGGGGPGLSHSVTVAAIMSLSLTSHFSPLFGLGGSGPGRRLPSLRNWFPGVIIESSVTLSLVLNRVPYHVVVRVAHIGPCPS